MKHLTLLFLGTFLGFPFLSSSLSEELFCTKDDLEPIDMRIMPNMAKTFQAVMEYYSDNQSLTNLLINYEFNTVESRVSFTRKIDKNEATIVYDFNRKQRYIFDRNGICEGNEMGTEITQDLVLNAIFPGLELQDRTEIFDPEILIGKSSRYEGYMGLQMIRNGIGCDTWLYCEMGETNFKNSSATILVYWSVPTLTTPSGSGQQPMGFVKRQLVNGVLTEKRLSIMNYIPNYVDPTSFEIPAGMFCYGMKGSPSFPDVITANIFRFETELIKLNENLIQESQTWIDSSYQYARIVTESAAAAPGVKITETVDASRGVVFQVKEDEEKCSVVRLNSWKPPMGSFVFNWTASEFLSPNITEWVYSGHKRVRSLNTEVWKGQKKNWLYENVTSLWEWHMTNVSKYLPEDKALTVETIPVFLRITLDKPDLPRIVFHVHNFDTDKFDVNDLDKFDVSNCYREPWMEYIQFKIDVSGQLISDVKSRYYILEWRLKLSNFLEISLLRITRPEIKLLPDNKTAVYKFLLLSIHPDVPKEKNNRNLMQAYQNLSRSVDLGLLDFKKGKPIRGTVTFVVKQKPTTPPPPTRTTSHFSTTPHPEKTTTPYYVMDDQTDLHTAGTAVGVSVGAFLGGAAIGCAVTLTIAFYKPKICFK